MTDSKKQYIARSEGSCGTGSKTRVRFFNPNRGNPLSMMLIAIMKPTESWAARWQGISNFVPGCYALRVRGTLASEHIVTLEDNGIRYRPLDEEGAQMAR